MTEPSRPLENEVGRKGERRGPEGPDVSRNKTKQNKMCTCTCE